MSEVLPLQDLKQTFFESVPRDINDIITRMVINDLLINVDYINK